MAARDISIEVIDKSAHMKSRGVARRAFDALAANPDKAVRLIGGSGMQWMLNDYGRRHGRPIATARDGDYVVAWFKD